MKKMFFGWSNIKWVAKELLAMYSNEKSYFSKKRFESSIAFLSALIIIGHHVWYTRSTISNSEILADAALLFAIAGYTVSHIQSEKKTLVNIPENTTIPKESNTKNKIESGDFSKDEDSV